MEEFQNEQRAKVLRLLRERLADMDVSVAEKDKAEKLIVEALKDETIVNLFSTFVGNG